jgi:prepilin-type N-terminal cleavage/methylation domain-containing protein
MKRTALHFAFTLLELVLVMLIIAIMAGMLAPAMAKFAAGRAVDNFGRQIIGAAQFARAQSISEGRTYRLNFDPGAEQIWLTADSGGGTFTALSGEFSEKIPAPRGVQMQVQVTQRPNISLMLPPNVQQQAMPQPSTLIDGTETGPAGQLMQNVRTGGSTYVEFSPMGRCDPATINLTDTTGHTMQVSCATPTDRFQEVQQ